MLGTTQFHPAPIASAALQPNPEPVRPDGREADAKPLMEHADRRQRLQLEPQGSYPMFVQLSKEFMGRKPGERIDVSEDDARALVAQQLATPVTDDLITPAVQKAMEQAFAGFQKGLDAVINSALQQFADAQHRSRKNAVPAIFGPGNDGDPQGKTFGDWLVNVAICTTGKGDRSAAAKRLGDVYGSGFQPWQKAAMGESSGTTGGYIVPPDFYQQLLAISAESNLFRQFAFVQPMASATLQFPYLDITTVQSAGNSPFFGGVIASWTSEAQTRETVVSASSDYFVAASWAYGGTCGQKSAAMDMACDFEMASVPATCVKQCRIHLGANRLHRERHPQVSI
jgi:hypothetical protein